MTGFTFNRPGFKGFRRPEAIGADVLAALETRFTGDERYVLYTGGAYSRRRASARSAALATITEERVPISILEFLKRAARSAGEGEGIDPNIALGGLALHAGAKPAVYLYLYRKGNDYLAVKDIPNPDPNFSARPFRANEVVFSVASVVAESEGSKDVVEGAASTKGSKKKGASAAA